jgi:hypothetical protein
MSGRAPVIELPIIPCRLRPETRNAITEYAKVLIESAPTLGDHGLDPGVFWESGLFQSAIERLRGQRAASMGAKRSFISLILEHLKSNGLIRDWVAAGGGDRHDYEVTMPDDTVAAIEAKGCLDGNNTNIFQRPPNADEFVIWSLCQNVGADPRHNVWSGIHTRLTAEIIHRRQRVDGLIVWDMLCGTVGRICPKTEGNSERTTAVGRKALPPPCIYLFPRTIPDPRNNPSPRCWHLDEVKFLSALHRAFHGREDDVTEVRVETDMDGTTVRRTTRFYREGQEIACSKPTPLKRATT